MRAGRAIAALSAVLLLAACSQAVRGDASAGSPGSPASPSSPAPSPPSGEADDPDADTGAKSGPATGGADDPGAAQVTGINFRSDGSSARLVVNLSGNGVPEWDVAYSDASGPDGVPVDIAGDAFLRVRVSSDAVGDSGNSRVSISPGPVAEARTTGAAGGYDEVLIGVRGGEQPFSVEALTDPGRLVVEVRDAG